MRMVSSSFICDISNISIVVVSMVLDMLDTSIWKQNTVTSLYIAIAISCLSSIKICSTVVIMDTVLVTVRMWCFLVHWGVISWCMVNWDMMNRSMMCRSCLLYTSPSPRDATLSRMPSSA